MRKLKELIFTFSTVTTCCILASAVYIQIFWNIQMIDTAILWQIPVTGFLCTLGNFLWSEEKRKQCYYIKIVLHYLYVNAVVLLCGFIFEWFYIDDLNMVLGMLVLIAIVFFLIFFLMQLYSKKDSERINQRLQEYIEKRHDTAK